MVRPKVICHMLTSIDGKVTGDFLYKEECEDYTEEYYRINREFKADAYACGRITMETSFTGGWKPDTERCDAVYDKNDFVVPDLKGFYAVAFDRKGSLGWKESTVCDPDPGYGGAQIIEVLTENVEPRFLGYLKKIGISYIFAGKDDIDIPLALEKLKRLFNIETLLLEGGSIINGAFQRAGVVDELSLVTVPIVAQRGDKPLFYDSEIEGYTLTDAVRVGESGLWLRYKKIQCC